MHAERQLKAIESYGCFQAASPTLSAGRAVAATGDVGRLRSVAAEKALLRYYLVELLNHLLLALWADSCKQVSAYNFGRIGRKLMAGYRGLDLTSESDSIHSD